MKYFDHFFQPPGWQEKTFTAQDGVTLRYGYALPQGAVRGNAVITTGYADSIETYFDTVQSYLDRGYAVFVMDWAGQGGSAKKGMSQTAPRAFGVPDHVAHLHEFRQKIVAPLAVPGPVVLSTHSLGGQIGLQYLRQHAGDFDAAIMAAPLVDFTIPARMRRFLSTVFRYAASTGLRDAAWAGSRAQLQRQAVSARKRIKAGEPVRVDLHRMFFMMSRPLGAEDPSVRLVDSLLDSTDTLRDPAALQGIATPVLLGVAGRDHIVNNDAIRRAAQWMPSAKLIELPDGTHGIWADRPEVRRQWWVAVDSFMTEQHNRFNPPVPPAKALPPRPPEG